MPSYTSVQSGYWSDPNTWSPNGVPKEGDTVTIEAGHTVILDLDLSGFPNGLAGLTVNGTLLIPSLNDPSYSEVGEETSGSPWLEGGVTEELYSLTILFHQLRSRIFKSSSESILLTSSSKARCVKIAVTFA